MAIYELTNGDIAVTTPNCDCGSTGGCEKCRTKIIPKHIDVETFIAVFNEGWQEQTGWKYWKLREIRDKSHRELGKAWELLGES